MKKALARTELQAIWAVLGREPREIPYALREGRYFMDSPKEILEGFSGARTGCLLKIISKRGCCHRAVSVKK